MGGAPSGLGTWEFPCEEIIKPGWMKNRKRQRNLRKMKGVGTRKVVDVGQEAWTWGGKCPGTRTEREGLNFTEAKYDSVHKSLRLKINIHFLSPKIASCTFLKWCLKVWFCFYISSTWDPILDT